MPGTPILNKTHQNCLVTPKTRFTNIISNIFTYLLAILKNKFTLINKYIKNAKKSEIGSHRNIYGQESASTHFCICGCGFRLVIMCGFLQLWLWMRLPNTAGKINRQLKFFMCFFRSGLIIFVIKIKKNS